MEFNITNYIVRFAGGADEATYIFLFDGNNTQRAVLIFGSPNTPAQKVTEMTGQQSPSYLVYMQMVRYEHIIDVLRNEKPIIFKYVPQSGTVYVETHFEPVGEGEISPVMPR